MLKSPWHQSMLNHTCLCSKVVPLFAKMISFFRVATQICDHRGKNGRVNLCIKCYKTHVCTVNIHLTITITRIIIIIIITATTIISITTNISISISISISIIIIIVIIIITVILNFTDYFIQFVLYYQYRVIIILFHSQLMSIINK